MKTVTDKHPLNFFIELIENKGLPAFKKGFSSISEKEEHQNYLVYYKVDTEEKIYQNQNPETGEFENASRTFKQYLTNIISKEYIEARDAIDREILGLTTETHKSTYLSSILAHLKRLYSLIQYSEARHYPLIKKAIKGLTNGLQCKYMGMEEPELSKEFKTDKIDSKSSDVLTNKQFIEKLHISSRTAQNYRTKGLITYSLIGRKVFYKATDIEVFIHHHSKKYF